MKHRKICILASGAAAGAVNGLFGAGGGMILVPLLVYCDCFEEKEIFPASVAIILPISLVSLLLSRTSGNVTFIQVLPYLLGSALGGIIAGLIGRKISVVWLHRLLGVLILWGGIRYLC